MITLFKRDEIDVKQYNICLEKAIQNSDYAAVEFLDIVAEKKWGILVYNNYEAVMPVAFKNKFGWKFVLMPKLCQQLGIFSKEDQPEINTIFYHFLMKKFSVIFYAFNSKNKFSFEPKIKTSYLIEQNSYEDVLKNYSIHRRRNIRLIGDLPEQLSFRHKTKKSDRLFVLSNMKGISSNQECLKYYHLSLELQNKGIGKFIIMDYKGKIQSFVYLYEGKKRFYLSLFVNNFPVIRTNFPSIMIDHCLQEIISVKDFDFMGSELENVAKFNQRFGAVAYTYPIISQSKADVVKNLLKKYIPFCKSNFSHFANDIMKL